MKQVSQNYKTGKIALEEVSVPTLKSGGLLVRMHYSVISAGTEGMKVKEGNLSYLGKARARPDKVKQVLNTVQFPSRVRVSATRDLPGSAESPTYVVDADRQ